MRDYHRRTALVRLAAGGLAAIGMKSPAHATRAAGPNDRLNLAIIGCGGQGAENLKQVASENIVALCDVDEERAADAFHQYPKARRFRDYRKLLDTIHGQIDAV